MHTTRTRFRHQLRELHMREMMGTWDHENDKFKTWDDGYMGRMGM